MSTGKFYRVIQQNIVGGPYTLAELTLSTFREIDLDLAIDDVLDFEGFLSLDVEEFHDLAGVDVHAGVSLCFHY